MSTARPVARSGLSPDAVRTVERHEERYGTRFQQLIHFDRRALGSLHAPGTLPDTVRVASGTRPDVIDRMATVTSVANLPEPRHADRDRYLRALLDIYAMLPVQAADAASLPGAAVLAPEREGRILAELLGVIPHDRCWTPQAKRMPAEGGLLVGVDGRLPAAADRLVIVDGVVASGVTLMAMMRLAAAPGAVIDVFTCHATEEGALALVRCAQQLGLTLTLHAGHVSGVLNDTFYSVDPGAPATLLLGDIGDTISPVAPDVAAEGTTA
ncbi:hypothetical protein QQY24_26265 [Streptomyces sp. TG1A-8]|uniref:hypothetical protein n=1 Tax=Streptomyces sp. TG1A-8 TaxID=3051385 RepID=UPI00265C14BF|nr:hypothetical protein [Streptomyces sp. TG1A-8]MDO0928747.1 hypothetical protein [Streptomyces sp. TG1A-8]